MIEDLKNYRAPRRSPWPSILGAALAVSILGVLGPLDYADAIEREAEGKLLRVELVLLEDSGRPADLDECQRAQPKRPRPRATISVQDRTGEPWIRRTCFFEVRG